MQQNTSNLVTVYDSKDNEALIRYILKITQELYRFRYALQNFVVDSLRTRYRKSVLGFLWSLLNPLFLMIILAVVFSSIYKADVKTFAVFIFTGLVPWLFISSSIAGGTMSLINAEGFLKKVYIPKALFPIAMVMVETVNFFFSILSLYLVALVLGFQVSSTIILLPLVMVITFFFNLGIVLMVSVATIYFRDLTHIITILLQALFYTVPIVYSLDILAPEVQRLFLWNPFYYFINLFRKVIYGQPAFHMREWLIPIGLACVSMLLGLWILKHNDRVIIYHL